MIKSRKVSDAKRDEIKRLHNVSKLSVRDCGRKAGVSYYTAWMVINGKYDGERLQPKKQGIFEGDNTCPITGYKLFNWNKYEK
ncbi:MAG TPA: hypothetical protein PKV73_01360 [Agriterribacter sp.]|nr:hypothetical protein [Agriterribacter sp.]